MSEWISVDEKRKLPLEKGEESFSETVLLYVPIFANQDDKGIRMGAYLYRSKKFRPHGCIGYENDVTHWMPLPTPPSASDSPKGKGTPHSLTTTENTD